jgi:hypothetical protein
MGFGIEPEIIVLLALIPVKTQTESIYTVNGTSTIIVGQSTLVALKTKLVEPTVSVAVAVTVIWPDVGSIVMQLGGAGKIEYVTDPQFFDRGT